MFLQSRGLMVKEEGGLPASSLPPCAPQEVVKLFSEGRGRGPNLENLQFNWRKCLGSCKWNRQAISLLGEHYLAMFRSGQIKHRGRVLRYDPKVNIILIKNTIRLRLQRTQTHWRNENTTRHEVNLNPLVTREERGILTTEANRRRNRAAQVLASLYFDLAFFTNLSSPSYSKIGKKLSKIILMVILRISCSKC